MMGERTPAAISRPLAALRATGIDFRQTAVERIDPGAQAVTTSDGALPYDYLVVALGAALDAEALPGLAEAGLTPYTMAGAEALRDAWRQLDRGSVAVVIPSLPFKCPAAPYEAALLLESGFRKRGVRDQISLEVYTPEPFPMPVTGESVGDALRSLLSAREIGFHAKKRLTSVDSGAQQMTFEDGLEVPYDLLVYVPPHRSSAVIRESSLAGEDGWIPVDARTLRTADPRVYAIGDVTAVDLANGMRLPKAGVFAHGEGQVVAARIAARILGGEERATFDGWGGCFVEVGDGRAAYGSGDFLAAPAPAVRIHAPTRSWHAGKVAFEKAWLAALSGRGVRSRLAFSALGPGGRRLLEAHWLWNRV